MALVPAVRLRPRLCWATGQRDGGAANRSRGQRYEKFTTDGRQRRVLFHERTTRQAPELHNYAEKYAVSEALAQHKVYESLTVGGYRSGGWASESTTSSTATTIPGIEITVPGTVFPVPGTVNTLDGQQKRGRKRPLCFSATQRYNKKGRNANGHSGPNDGQRRPKLHNYAVWRKGRASRLSTKHLLKAMLKDGWTERML